VSQTALRKIIHIDCDCFYAAIEMRDDPSLARRPIAVGGAADRRGVIATCNYEARAYGVRSAMASGHALKLCPDLLILRPRMEAYREASREIHEIFRTYTEQIEPLSLDEAYLDVSACEHFAGSATRIAEDIRRRVWQHGVGRRRAKQVSRQNRQRVEQAGRPVRRHARAGRGVRESA